MSNFNKERSINERLRYILIDINACENIIQNCEQGDEPEQQTTLGHLSSARTLIYEVMKIREGN